MGNLEMFLTLYSLIWTLCLLPRGVDGYVSVFASDEHAG